MKRRRRRNPSSHPILAFFATLIGEGAIGALTFYTLKRVGVSYNLCASVASLGGAVGGYAIGAHYWPKSKTPILAGSFVHLLLSGVGYAVAAASALTRKTPPEAHA